MPTRRSPLLVPLVLFACTDRPLGETEASTAGPNTSESPPATGTTDDPPGTATTPTSTTTSPLPTTATTDATTATTIDPGATTTVDPSATTAVDPSTGTTVDPGGTTVDPGGTTDDPQPKLDLFEPEPTSGLFGCTLDAPAGTMVSGSSTLGPFAAQRAYFGFDTLGEEPYSPRLLFVSPAADPAVEVQQLNGSTGPILHGFAWSDPFEKGGWIGQWPLSAYVFAEGMVGDIARPETVVIDARLGNWDAHDPADPPRLVGSLQGGVSGPFDAVFCDKLVAIIIPE
ncbi:hypothetical protein [Nannocystis bainbridge]|uniref:Uncharacterized protein n=1 Tax=Nannocystis bainbridge TaxID=2995303 RepID=A0ABT5DTS7_9BACT|nr:hypothetical protein [Nannocystis bainbridge]MDC0715801.1 hypothetical protein [Nannocystis bainbridge]